MTLLTTCSELEGPEGERVKRTRQNFQNNLFGTFTSAKEKIVAAGRALFLTP